MSAINRTSCLFFVFIGLLSLEVSAQQATMYAALIKSKGYVVGSTLSASGLHRHDGDTLWVHLGYNNPRINAMSYDPTHPDTMFVAAGNGAMRTLDGGKSWRITTGWRITEVQDVDVDPNAPGHVYIGTAYGVWRTEDLGNTWQEASAGIPNGKTYAETVEVDYTTAHRVLAGTNDGVYVSEDGGRLWRYAGGAGLEILDLQQSRMNAEIWLAATYRHGILISRDKGKTWEAAGPPALRSKSVHGVAIDPFDENHMVAAGWGTGVYVSQDGGKQWVRRGDTLPVDNFYEVAFDANIPGRIYAATLEEGLYFSDDQGETWSSGGLYGTLIFDIQFVHPR